ncbi:hypothetical protein, partial [Vibrio parahaemolyticus]|uniref:hypothetical protein n=2 Tax=Vibrio TaxID=662 RepID=UPI0025521CD9
CVNSNTFSVARMEKIATDIPFIELLVIKNKINLFLTGYIYIPYNIMEPNKKGVQKGTPL